MKIEKSEQLKIKLKGKDAEDFKSAVKKLSEENRKVGFKSSSLNDDEVKVINKVAEKL